VDPVPDPLLLRKSGSAGDRTRDLCICSQKLWPLDHRGGQQTYQTQAHIDVSLYSCARYVSDPLCDYPFRLLSCLTEWLITFLRIVLLLFLFLFSTLTSSAFLCLVFLLIIILVHARRVSSCLMQPACALEATPRNVSNWKIYNTKFILKLF